jgi:hypothetical protein
MARNFGSPHVFSRATVLPRKLPGLRARLLYTCERLFQCAPYSLGKAHRPSGQQIAVDVIYMGRVIFHVGETRTYAQEKYSQTEGKTCAL